MDNPLRTPAVLMQRMYNDRPLDPSGPPIQIYHPAFATFVQESVDTATTFTPETLDRAREFVSVSPGFHEDEFRWKGELERSEFWGSTLMGVIGLLFESGGSDPISQTERSYASNVHSTGVGLFSSHTDPPLRDRG